MKKVLLILFSCLVSLFTLTDLFAAESQVFIQGIRPLGMGGSFIALSDDQNAVFYNPAGLTQRQGGQFTLFELPINASEDVFNFYNYYRDNEDRLKNFDSQSNEDKIDILNEINDRIVTYKPQVKTGFPNSSYLSGNGFLSYGFGLFSVADLGFQFNRSLIIPSVSFWGNVDLMAAVPLAHRFDKLPYIPGKLSVGTTLKYINRGRIAEYNKSVLEFENLDPQVQLGKGFGFDLGTMYQPTDRWNVGLQVTDVGGTSLKFDEVKSEKAGQLDMASFTGMIPSQWNIGAAYIPSKIVYWPGKSINTLDRLVFAADVRDFASTDERLFDATFWKKLHMGAEFRYGPVSLRGGFNSGYPSFGAGVRIPYLGLKADYAYWGEELGRYAGQIPSWNHQVTLALSWGDSRGRAFGKDTIKKDAAAVKKTADKKATESNKTSEALKDKAATTATQTAEKVDALKTDAGKAVSKSTDAAAKAAEDQKNKAIEKIGQTTKEKSVILKDKAATTATQTAEKVDALKTDAGKAVSQSTDAAVKAAADQQNKAVEKIETTVEETTKP